MAKTSWNQRYADGDAPWDTGQPDGHLTELVDAGVVRPGRALEVGCGTGTNLAWLAGRGFAPVGLDISPLAIEQAGRRCAETGVQCELHVLDFLQAAPPGPPFPFVYDRGVFHVFDQPDERARYAQRVAEVLSEDGLWVSVIGSTEGPARDSGPPRRTLRDIASAVEPALEIESVRSVRFDESMPAEVKGWVLLARRRAVPAQPSTVR